MHNNKVGKDYKLKIKINKKLHRAMNTIFFKCTSNTNHSINTAYVKINLAESFWESNVLINYRDWKITTEITIFYMYLIIAAFSISVDD